MGSILTSNNNIFKAGSTVFTSGDDLPPAVLDLNPATWSGYANNDPLPILLDSAGSNNAQQPSGSLQALYKTNQINGLPAFQSDGDDYYTLAASVVAASVFVVAKASVVAQGFRAMFSSATPQFAFLGSDNAYFSDTPDTSPTGVGNNPINKLFVNGLMLATMSQGTRNTFYTLMYLDVTDTRLISHICNDPQNLSTRGYEGQIARLIVYDQRLTAIQRQTKTAELLTLYGL